MDAFLDEVYDRPTNLKPRKVRCMKCGFTTVTDLPGPKCSQCKRYMVTLLSDEQLADKPRQSA